MFAITLNEESYIASFSDKYRTPESILVDELPDADPEKLKCYKYVIDEFVFDADMYSLIESRKSTKCQIESITSKIATLKDVLNSTDYRIIKCCEYSLSNLELPYDIESLHAERQALRDQINALEDQLNTKEE